MGSHNVQGQLDRVTRNPMIFERIAIFAGTVWTVMVMRRWCNGHVTKMTLRLWVCKSVNTRKRIEPVWMRIQSSLQCKLALALWDGCGSNRDEMRTGLYCAGNEDRNEWYWLSVYMDLLVKHRMTYRRISGTSWLTQRKFPVVRTSMLAYLQGDLVPANVARGSGEVHNKKPSSPLPPRSRSMVVLLNVKMGLVQNGHHVLHPFAVLFC